MTFLAQKFRDLLYLDSITCIVDAEGIFEHADSPNLTMLKLRQIGYSDMVILNKTDLVGPENVEVIKEWVSSHLNRVRIIEAVYCEVPLEILLAVGRFEPETVLKQSKLENNHDRQHVGRHSHDQMFDTWSYESEHPFSLKALREMVRKDLPASIYRCKGIVFTDDSPEKRLAHQTVGRRTEIFELDIWGGRIPRSQIVAIGAPGGIDGAELTKQFDACVAKVGEAD